MLDNMLNPTPTFYKWDKFWTGFVPALLLPFVCALLFFVFTYFNSTIIHNTNYSFKLFLYSFQNPMVFMRVTSLCCIPNAALFFLFLRKNYYNAARAVIFVTMIFILAIVIVDTIMQS